MIYKKDLAKIKKNIKNYFWERYLIWTKTPKTLKKLHLIKKKWVFFQ